MNNKSNERVSGLFVALRAAAVPAVIVVLHLLSGSVVMAASQKTDSGAALKENLDSAKTEGSESDDADKESDESSSDLSKTEEESAEDSEGESSSSDNEKTDEDEAQTEDEEGESGDPEPDSTDKDNNDSPDEDESVFAKDLEAHGVRCNESGVCEVIATGLPLRALPRSFSPLYASNDDAVDPISNSVSAFKPMFIFDIQNLDDRDVTDITGWYQVGYSDRRAIGWMKARDVIEWRQALLLEYTHPGGGSNRRTPVLMFSDMQPLQDFVTSNGRKSRTVKLLDSIESGDVPDSVIGKEPGRFLNIDDDFYLLPVVNWKREESFDDPSHYLQVVAAVPGSRAETKGESTLKDEDYLKEDLLSGAAITDVVFVMDMTGSMQPYIDAVKTTVGSLVAKLVEGEDDAEAVRFGLIGYRDSVEVTPELDWDVKDFTPTLLPASEFLEVLIQAEAAKVSSDEWAENVHGGYLAGIKAKWRTLESDRKSIRLMLMVGDASGHIESNNKNSTGNSASDLYELARTTGIYPFTIHLKDKRAEREWDTAQAQFADFSFKQTDGNNLTFSAQTDNAEENLSGTAQYIGGRIKALIEQGTDALDTFSKSDADPEAPVMSNEEGQQMIELARGLMQAAIADFLGDGVKPPRDFTSWVHDYDLADATREALSVRVMISRKQLDNIIRQTEILVDTIQMQTLGNVDFLVALKQASARTSLGLELKTDSSFEDQEFLPGWIASLPYKSRVMAMSPDEFANLKVNERKQFLARLESKLNAYNEVAGTVDRWLKLDENDDSLQEVVALPLTLLP